MKAVLVIEMPDNVFLDEWTAKVYVDRVKMPVDEMMNGVVFDESRTFSFVPLKPMPDTFSTKKITGNDNVSRIERSYIYGWNDCLREITGETE